MCVCENSGKICQGEKRAEFQVIHKRNNIKSSASQTLMVFFRLQRDQLLGGNFLAPICVHIRNEK